MQTSSTNFYANRWNDSIFDVEVGDADAVDGGNVDTELLRLGTSNRANNS